ncbi:hypothetical protein C4K01_4125 [Pseudomonas synxantha]|nr:hypothetical protein C4K01_4125 [Pseudomonas synxantha]
MATLVRGEPDAEKCRPSRAAHILAKPQHHCIDTQSPIFP